MGEVSEAKRQWCALVDRIVPEDVRPAVTKALGAVMETLIEYVRRARMSRLVTVEDEDSHGWVDLDRQILAALRAVRGAGVRNAADALYAFAHGFFADVESVPADEHALLVRLGSVCKATGVLRVAKKHLGDTFPDDPQRDTFITAMRENRARLVRWGYLR